MIKVRVYFTFLGICAGAFGIALVLFSIPVSIEMQKSGNMSVFRLIFSVFAFIFGLCCLYIFYLSIWDYSKKTIERMNVTITIAIFSVLPVSMKRVLAIERREDELFCYAVSLLVVFFLYKLNKKMMSKYAGCRKDRPER